MCEWTYSHLHGSDRTQVRWGLSGLAISHPPSVTPSPAHTLQYFTSQGHPWWLADIPLIGSVIDIECVNIHIYCTHIPQRHMYTHTYARSETYTSRIVRTPHMKKSQNNTCSTHTHSRGGRAGRGVVTGGLAEAPRVKILSEEHFRFRTDDQTNAEMQSGCRQPMQMTFGRGRILVPESQTWKSEELGWNQLNCAYPRADIVLLQQVRWGKTLNYTEEHLDSTMAATHVIQPHIKERKLLEPTYQFHITCTQLHCASTLIKHIKFCFFCPKQMNNI